MQDIVVGKDVPAGKSAVAEAIRRAGNQKKMGEALKVSQQMVSMWLKLGYMPVKHVKKAEKLYGISCRKLINPRLLELVDAGGNDL